MKIIIITGHLTKGFEFFGPFADTVVAWRWAWQHLEPDVSNPPSITLPAGAQMAVLTTP